MKDYSELKRLAEAAKRSGEENGERWPQDDDWFEPDLISDEMAFVKAVSPTNVLTLIAELENLRDTPANQIVAAIIRSVVQASVEGMQSGVLAMVPQLRKENEALRECVEDLALSLECEVKARYAGTQKHPAIKPKYDGDMQEVIDARKLLNLGAE